MATASKPNGNAFTSSSRYAALDDALKKVGDTYPNMPGEPSYIKGPIFKRTDGIEGILVYVHPTDKIIGNIKLFEVYFEVKDNGIMPYGRYWLELELTLRKERNLE